LAKVKVKEGTISGLKAKMEFINGGGIRIHRNSDALDPNFFGLIPNHQFIKLV